MSLDESDQGATPTKAACGVRDQIERYRTAFIAVVSMILIAAFVGGYILSHENLKLPGLGAGARGKLFHAEGELPDRPGGDAGPGPGGHDRRGEDRRNRERGTEHGSRGTMHLIPKYSDGRIYRDATMLLRPKTAAEGRDGRGRSRDAGQRIAAQRRDDPAVADRSGRQPRRIPLARSTRKHAPRCRSCWPARAKG